MDPALPKLLLVVQERKYQIIYTPSRKGPNQLNLERHKPSH